MSRLGRPPRVLLVEDDAGDAQLMRIAFAETLPEVELRVASDGEAALALLSDPEAGAAPDLVLLDLNLPRLSGHELLALVRDSELPHARRAPVVVFTTSDARDDVARSYELGARSHVVKPRGIEALFATVASLGGYWFETVELPGEPD